MLIQNLRTFADFYVRATRAIEAATVPLKPWHTGDRDANAHSFREEFRATKDIDRIRALTLSRFGEELAIKSANQLLGALLLESKGTLTTDQAMSLALGDVADRLEKKRRKATGSNGGNRPKGPRSKNTVLLAFDEKVRKRNPNLTDKEVLDQFRVKHPNHPVFETTDPEGALRAARSRKRKKGDAT